MTSNDFNGYKENEFPPNPSPAKHPSFTPVFFLNTYLKDNMTDGLTSINWTKYWSYKIKSTYKLVPFNSGLVLKKNKTSIVRWSSFGEVAHLNSTKNEDFIFFYHLLRHFHGNRTISHINWYLNCFFFSYQGYRKAAEPKCGH